MMKEDISQREVYGGNALVLCKAILFHAVYGGAVAFVLASAFVAWRGVEFVLSDALGYCAMGAVVFGMMPISIRVQNKPLFRRNSGEIKQRRQQLVKERESMGQEAEILRSIHRLENED
jgi:hypothetical protein